MIRISTLTLTLLLASPSTGEEKEDGKINIRLELNSSLQKGSTDPKVTTVNYACIVASASEIACVYYYNGVAQTGSGDSLGSKESAAGPGTSGFTFVQPGTTITGYESGIRDYAASFASYRDGCAVSHTSASGEINLYSEKGRDLNWSVNFGADGIPTTTTF